MAAAFSELKKGIFDGANVVATKIRALTRSVKSSLDLIALKREIEMLFSELGGRTFELLSEDPQAAVGSDPEVLEWMEKIKELNEKFGAPKSEDEAPPAPEQ